LALRGIPDLSRPIFLRHLSRIRSCRNRESALFSSLRYLSRSEDHMRTGMKDEVREALSGVTCTVRDYQRACKLGKNQAYESVNRGDVDAIRIGGTWRIICAPLRKKLGLESETAPAA
jgi:hypothetical protein